MIYSSARTLLGKFLDIASYYVFMAFLWAFGAFLIIGTVVMIVCGIIQSFGGHTFLMDLP